MCSPCKENTSQSLWFKQNHSSHIQFACPQLDIPERLNFICHGCTSNLESKHILQPIKAISIPWFVARFSCSWPREAPYVSKWLYSSLYLPTYHQNSNKHQIPLRCEAFSTKTYMMLIIADLDDHISIIPLPQESHLIKLHNGLGGTSSIQGQDIVWNIDFLLLLHICCCCNDLLTCQGET